MSSRSVARPRTAALLLAAALALVVAVLTFRGVLGTRSGAAVLGGWFALVVSALALVAARRLSVRTRRRERDGEVRAEAERSLEAADQALAKLNDPEARRRLTEELRQIQDDRDARTTRVVVFGTGSAGKTSLVNALLGRAVGPVEATLGTTREGDAVQHQVVGLDSPLVIVDTPGLSEVGEGGSFRETLARDLAARADLILVVVDHDLTRSEQQAIVELIRVGKPALVLLNKSDRFPEADREAILARLRERLTGLVAPDDVLAIAANPQASTVLVREADGSEHTEQEAASPDLADLDARLAARLERDGETLRAANLRLRARSLGRQALDQLALERRGRARALVERYQWMTAGAVFANPVPALDLMAAAAIQFPMISEIARCYDVDLSSADAQALGGRVAKTLVTLGLVETATSLVAGVFKSSLVGFAAGGLVQATSLAYLTHVSGMAFLEYFERGGSWGDEGVQTALTRQFDLHGRAAFLREFAAQAVERLAERFRGAKPSASS